MRSLKYTNEDLLEIARRHYKKHARPPRLHDLGAGISTTIKKRFGSWGNYIQSSLKMVPNSHHWTREELLTFVRDFWSQNRRYPLADEMRVSGRDVSSAVRNFFGSTNDFFEEAIYRSPRTEILRAILELTPPGCSEATPREILSQIRVKVPFPANLMSYNVRALTAEGYITGGIYDRTRWWRLTDKGRAFAKAAGK